MSMETCNLQADPCLYGLSIRMAFYLQWLASLWFNFVDQRSLPDIRLLGHILSGSMMLALTIQLAERRRLAAAEIYTMIVLVTGGYILLVPIYVWKVLSGCDWYWDPMYWSKEEPLRINRMLNFATAVVASSVATWFFAAYLPGFDFACGQYGFLFGKVSLGNLSFIALNAILYVSILAVCAVILVFKCTRVVSRRTRIHHHHSRRGREEHIRFLAKLQVFSDATIWIVLVLAVELTIAYNDLSASNRVESTGQFIALLTSIGLCLRAWYVHVVGSETPSGNQLRGWPLTYESWAMAQQYQEAFEDAMQMERLYRRWRRQMQRACRQSV